MCGRCAQNLTFPFLSVRKPRPGHPLPPHPGTGLPLPAPAQGQATLYPPNHHPLGAPLHPPRGGFGGRMRQRRAWVRQDLWTRTRAKARPVRRRSQQPQPHQHPRLCPPPRQLSPRRSSPQPRSLQVGRARETDFACVGEVVRDRGLEVPGDWVLGDRKGRLRPSAGPGPEPPPERRTTRHSGWQKLGGWVGGPEVQEAQAMQW